VTEDTRLLLNDPVYSRPAIAPVPASFDLGINPGAKYPIEGKNGLNR
jgi:hypothetical protein